MPVRIPDILRISSVATDRFPSTRTSSTLNTKYRIRTRKAKATAKQAQIRRISFHGTPGDCVSDSASSFPSPASSAANAFSPPFQNGPLCSFTFSERCCIRLKSTAPSSKSRFSMLLTCISASGIYPGSFFSSIPLARSTFVCCMRKPSFCQSNVGREAADTSFPSRVSHMPSAFFLNRAIQLSFLRPQALFHAYAR